MPRTLLEGQHKSEALAERHLAELIRENREATVEIVARRNASGEFSTRGHFFTFEIISKEVEVDSLADFWKQFDGADDFEPIDEYESSADYFIEE
jgi:hypothetical protein